jgi:Spy/CpxP family protein refolding chaperone
MKNPIRKAVVPALISLAVFSGAAWAQTAPVSASSTSAMSSSSTAAKSHAQRRMDNVEQQITTMHSQLNITDAQSKQWDAYAQTMRDNAQKTSDALRGRGQKLATMNADDIMKSYAELAQMHADQMQKLSSAWSDLYAVLTPDQKQTADTLFHNRPLRPRPGTHNKHTAKPASASSAASPSGT